MMQQLFSFFGRRSTAFRTPKAVRMTWRVVKIDGPIRKEVGLKTEFGVIVSTDAMLEYAQTLLFCPLLLGEDKPQQLMPWHVAVSMEPLATGEPPPFADGVVSTKVVLPIALDEIDTDQKDRGRLKRESRVQVYNCLNRWLPTAAEVRA
jgi:hypothetical protein